MSETRTARRAVGDIAMVCLRPSRFGGTLPVAGRGGDLAPRFLHRWVSRDVLPERVPVHRIRHAGASPHTTVSATGVHVSVPQLMRWPGPSALTSPAHFGQAHPCCLPHRARERGGAEPGRPLGAGALQPVK